MIIDNPASRGATKMPPLSLLLATILLLVRCSARSVVLFSLPASVPLDNATIVRINPTVTVYDQALVDFWRLGAGPLAPVSSWNLSTWSGSGIAQLTDTRALLPPALQNGSTAVQFADGVFGASLNLFDTPMAPSDTLATITIEQNWSPQTRVAPWGAPGGALAMSIEYVAHSAFRTGVAVYSSWSLGLSHAVTGKYIWYESALWDLGRDLGGDELWIDTISGNVIVHGVLGTLPSAFHTMVAGSASSSNECWDGFRTFSFSISSTQVAAAIKAAEAKFNVTLGSDPKDWLLVHTNVELEGTPNVRGAHALRNMTITWMQAGTDGV